MFKNKKNFKVLIIGYGSIGKKHHNILKKILPEKNIFLLTQKKFNKNSIHSLKEIKSLNPQYIIISSITKAHYKQILYLEKNLKNKIVLVEKPIFEKLYKIKLKNNKYIVNYQLRLHPVILKIKKVIKKEKIFNVQVKCNSYLPSWRNENYKKIYSSQKKLGGGVLLDLSHEIDYVLWVFKKFKVNYFYRKKVSNLKINSDDLCVILGKFKNKGNIQINLSYFSKIEKREIQIDTQNFSFFGDLINNFYEIKSKNKKYKKKFLNVKQEKLIYLVHKKIINKSFKNLCDSYQGLKVMQFIKKLS